MQSTELEDKTIILLIESAFFNALNAEDFASRIVDTPFQKNADMLWTILSDVFKVGEDTAPLPTSIQEALNSGDGVYRP